jgi:hypothetical protein
VVAVASDRWRRTAARNGVGLFRSSTPSLVPPRWSTRPGPAAGHLPLSACCRPAFAAPGLWPDAARRQSPLSHRRELRAPGQASYCCCRRSENSRQVRVSIRGRSSSMIGASNLWPDGHAGQLRPYPPRRYRSDPPDQPSFPGGRT